MLNVDAWIAGTISQRKLQDQARTCVRDHSVAVDTAGTTPEKEEDNSPGQLQVVDCVIESLLCC
jgi:hypothetical protein